MLKSNPSVFFIFQFYVIADNISLTNRVVVTEDGTVKYSLPFQVALKTKIVTKRFFTYVLDSLIRFDSLILSIKEDV